MAGNPGDPLGGFFWKLIEPLLEGIPNVSGYCFGHIHIRYILSYVSHDVSWEVIGVVSDPVVLPNITPRSIFYPCSLMLLSYFYPDSSILDPLQDYTHWPSSYWAIRIPYTFAVTAAAHRRCPRRTPRDTTPASRSAARAGSGTWRSSCFNGGAAEI